jgi:uncharacterized protein YndB with AHSA1/START domain
MVRAVDQVTIDIAAPPEKVWSLLTDVTQMGRWSPECNRCAWVDGATGPEVGAKFKGWNKRGMLRWSTTSTVVTADAPTHFAWQVDKSAMQWGYKFDGDGEGGTHVTEYRNKVGELPLSVKLAYKLKLLGRDPDAIVLNGMRETLARLKAAAET